MGLAILFVRLKVNYQRGRHIVYPFGISNLLFSKVAKDSRLCFKLIVVLDLKNK